MVENIHVCCCGYLLQLLILIVMMNDRLQVTSDAVQQAHDTLGLIALDSMGNISAGKCIISEYTDLLIKIYRWLSSPRIRCFY